MFSILIPSFNNLEYLKTCIDSLKKNSKYKHQIIVHVNEGTDGSLEYVKENNLEYTFSNENIGMPKALNRSSALAKFDYILISHDDFYYCPGWDVELVNNVNFIGHNNFYLSSTMVGAGQVEFDAGQTVDNFDETKLLDNLEKIKTIDFQGTTKCPGLIHKEVWKRVGGWSEEFSPTGGDDTDFAMKLWNINIRIFKGLGKSLAYHFGSITTRKKDKSLFTYLGSRGNKIFLKKWGYNINFFENFFLRSGLDKNKNLIFNEYTGPLKEPKKDLNFYVELIKGKFKIFYLYLAGFK
ncbi:glycosyltransferase [Candidatus Pelagibacter ubique]|nr:glycosyltransferase [Candidatus Pelagibacter ubique]